VILIYLEIGKMLTVHTIVLNQEESRVEGIHEVYATIRNDYGKDEHGNNVVGKEWGFWMWGIGLHGSEVTQSGFASDEETQAAARQAYEESKKPRLPPPSKPVSSFSDIKGGVKARFIFGQIIALMREYHLTKPSSSPSRNRSFFAGNGTTSYPVSRGFSTQWWVTERGIEILEVIADTAIASDPALHGGDRASFCKAIENMLKANAINPELFDGDQLIFRDAKTLFEARSVRDANEFAYRLWNKMHEAMTNALTTWLVVYPLIRVKSQSISLGFDGLSLISPTDPGLWRQITTRYANAARWDPATEVPPELSPKHFEKELPTWIVCEVRGTQEGAQKLAARQIRTFLAVLFAHLYPHERALLTKSSAEEFTYSQQFAIDGSRATWGQGSSFLGRLLPPLIVDIKLTPEVIAEVTAWYAKQATADEEVRDRAVAATQFIGYGIVADELERFIYFFVGLDALFGVRRKVEAKIVEGIKLTFPGDSTWEYRTPKLFDLRSSLVHGASASIADWKELDAYRRHIKSHPLRDVTMAVMTALRQYPDNYPPKRTSVASLGNSTLVACVGAFLLGALIVKRT
jgi:hypothetical protein